MRNEYFSKAEYGELTIYSLLLNLFVKLGYNHINTGNLFPNVRLYKQKEYVQKFNTLMDYIDEHYMEDLNLETIAKSIGFSKFHFSRLFKQYTNFTFCDYLCYRRIKVAEELLAEPDLSITEIALQAGFPSISTFNRLFKQRKNCTPSEYRSKNNFTATKKP
jgi:AraC-like DNA-binding protein